MLIDSNAYLGHWPFRKLEYNTPEALLGRMKEFGTDLSVISNLNGIFYKNTQHANDELSEWINSKRSYKDRFIPFAVINPIYGGWRDDFNSCVNRYGCKGVRLYPQYHRYDITNPFCVELVKMCRDKGLPVAFSLRMVDSRTSSWLDIEQEWSLKDIMPVVRAVPDARYMVLNVANSLSVDKNDMDILNKAEMLVDTSGRALTDIGRLLKDEGKEHFAFGAHTPILGKERLAFGTHSPILDYFSGLLRIESLRENEADEQTKELLRAGNIRRMLGI